MNESDARDALQMIRFEAPATNAHYLEDLFHQAVLWEVSQGCPYSEKIARIALQTLDIEKDRWYE